jgi:hypothetical protein
MVPVLKKVAADALPKPTLKNRAKNAEAAEVARKATADVAQVPKLLEVSRAEPNV